MLPFCGVPYSGNLTVMGIAYCRAVPSRGCLGTGSAYRLFLCPFCSLSAGLPEQMTSLVNCYDLWVGGFHLLVLCDSNISLWLFRGNWMKPPVPGPHFQNHHFECSSPQSPWEAAFNQCSTAKEKSLHDGPSLCAGRSFVSPSRLVFDFTLVEKNTCCAPEGRQI